MLKQYSHQGFQSRNRGSFDFKQHTEAVADNRESQFQSRNRGSFDFKFPCCISQCSLFLFQSRNRGSFDFKPKKTIF